MDGARQRLRRRLHLLHRLSHRGRPAAHAARRASTPTPSSASSTRAGLGAGLLDLPGRQRRRAGVRRSPSMPAAAPPSPATPARPTSRWCRPCSRPSGRRHRRVRQPSSRPAGAALVYSTYLGGSGDDLVYAVADNGFGRVHLTGYTTSTTSPPSRIPAQATLGGGHDGFAAAFGPSGLTAAVHLSGWRWHRLRAGRGHQRLQLRGGRADRLDELPHARGVAAGSAGLDDAFVTRFTLESAPVPASDGLADAGAGCVAVAGRRDDVAVGAAAHGRMCAIVTRCQEWSRYNASS